MPTVHPHQDWVVTALPHDPSNLCSCTTYRALPASRQSGSVPMHKGGVRGGAAERERWCVEGWHGVGERFGYAGWIGVWRDKSCRRQYNCCGQGQNWDIARHARACVAAMCVWGGGEVIQLWQQWCQQRQQDEATCIC